MRQRSLPSKMTGSSLPMRTASDGSGRSTTKHSTPKTRTAMISKARSKHHALKTRPRRHCSLSQPKFGAKLGRFESPFATSAIAVAAPKTRQSYRPRGVGVEAVGQCEIRQGQSRDGRAWVECKITNDQPEHQEKNQCGWPAGSCVIGEIVEHGRG